MVNEERVKQLYKLARYEKNEEKQHRQAGQYYKLDYIMKEVLKSIVTGTLGYALMAFLWMMSDWEMIMHQINTLEIVNTLIGVGIFYVVFMVIYIFATVMIYKLRYQESKRKIDVYVEDLKRAYVMFDKEENLKK